MKHRFSVATILTTSLLATCSLDAQAKQKDMGYKSSSDPKSADEYKNKRLSKLLGHKVRWKSVTDVNQCNQTISHDASNLGNLLIRGRSYQWSTIKDSGYCEEGNTKLQEIEIDPSMAPIVGSGRTKPQSRREQKKQQGQSK